MDEALSDLDTAWHQVAAAQEQGDWCVEARALVLLELALYQAVRDAEADWAGRRAVEIARMSYNRHAETEIQLFRFEMWMRLGKRLEADRRSPGSLVFNDHRDTIRDVYRHALKALDKASPFWRESVEPELMSVEVRQLIEEVKLRANDPLMAREAPALSSPLSMALELTIAVGFVATNVLGPFLQEWAKKLGEQFGESTVYAIKRIRWHRRLKDRHEIQVAVPGNPRPTILILPEPLSDAAKLAIIDLDLTDPAIHSKTLYWHHDGVFREGQDQPQPP